MPFFVGRVPALAVERLRMVKPNSAKCVVVAVFGNRAYDDALLEMQDVASEVGFRVMVLTTRCRRCQAIVLTRKVARCPIPKADADATVVAFLSEYLYFARLALSLNKIGFASGIKIKASFHFVFRSACTIFK